MSKKNFRNKTNNNNNNRRNNCHNEVPDTTVKSGSKSQKYGKRFELNVPDSSANQADLRVLTATNSKNNDFSWYNRLDVNLENVAHIPMNLLTGLANDPLRRDNGSVTGTLDPGTATVPGIMTLSLAPSIGVTTAPTDAANVAAQQLYVAVTQKNNRDGKYDKTDLMMMCLAVDSAYGMIEYFCRLYKSINKFKTENRYLPYALVSAQTSALGYEVATYNKLMAHMADFRAAINNAIYALASVNVPDVLTYFSRHSWLYSHVYKDADSEKAQMYLYNPAGFYVWKEGVGTSANYLQFYTFEELWDESAITVEAIVNCLNKLIKPIIGSSIVGLMSSDIAMAFSGGQMIKLQYLEEDEMIEPVYDEEVLFQMSNCTVMTTGNGLTNQELESMKITQVLTDLVSGPYLVYQPKFVNVKTNYNYTCAKPLLNFRGEPTIEKIVEATRLVTMCGAMTENSLWPVTTCGAEMVISARIFYYSYTYSNGMFTNQKLNGVNFSQTNVLELPTDTTTTILLESAKNIIRNVRRWAAFDWAPTIYNVVNSEGSGNVLFLGTMQDYDNYIYLNLEQLVNLNNVVMLSLFKVED